MNMLDIAREYARAGLVVLPAVLAEKRPAIGTWRQYCERRPTDDEIATWFAADRDALCVLCGAISGNLEMIDFDFGGELFDSWSQLVESESPGLLDRLVVERSQSGGYHVIYRCEVEVNGNTKLAQRKLDDGRIATLIETRGERGLFLCAPTPGYVAIRGDLRSLPTITAEERDALLGAAHALNEYIPPPIDYKSSGHAHTLPGSNRPGDDFNARGDVGALLRQHGWTLARDGANQYWRRPDKKHGWSATLKDNVLYVFSANAAPFEPGRAYSPFAVYAMLEHGGDWAQAASALRMQGYGSAGTMSTIQVTTTTREERVPEIDDPGPTPVDMLRVPGFISEVMDYTLMIAPYPNQVMAFAGALALQAVLAGRKVRDPGDNRTNIYLLGLAYSSAGKDHARKVNSEILNAVGMSDCLGMHFASGEGLQDALYQTPSMLFQVDEIDGLLQAINKSKEARHEAIMTTLLTLYSSANSVYPMRRKAGMESAGVIDQPCLVIYGTAIPNHYYDALSERMLTNGFFARTIVLESGPRPSGQEPMIVPLPDRVLETAKWWADYQPGERPSNMSGIHPVPDVVEQTEEARQLLIAVREAAEAEYAKAESRSDPVGTTVWGRTSEQVRKLALLYAISESHEAPLIGRDAVRWATNLVMHQTRRMLFMAASHVAQNPFHADCLRAIEKLREAPNGELPHSVLLKRMKMDAKSFAMMMETLVQQGDVEEIKTPRAGWPVRSYRLVGGNFE